MTHYAGVSSRWFGPTPGPQIVQFQGDWFFLSNFSYSPIVYEGTSYATVEHAFQAAKTNNDSLRRVISLASSAQQAKRMGRKLNLRENWDIIRIGVMHQLLSLKFQPPGPLAYRLHNTGTRPLIEGNSWGDTFWGVDIKTAVGQNHLGRLLMFVRETNAACFAAARRHQPPNRER